MRSTTSATDSFSYLGCLLSFGGFRATPAATALADAGFLEVSDVGGLQVASACVVYMSALGIHSLCGCSFYLRQLFRAGGTTHCHPAPQERVVRQPPSHWVHVCCLLMGSCDCHC